MNYTELARLSKATMDEDLFLAFPPTVWRLAKVAIFTTNVDAENQCLINHKTVCGDRNRHFCQTAVISWPFFCCPLIIIHFYWSKVSQNKVNLSS